MPADAIEIRVLGCLIEKQRTTPDAYPLSLNSLRLACNQATNRDPVVEYDERAIRDALQRLASKRWTRLASDAGSRAAKYRHLLAETLSLEPPQLAVLAVLMLRGAQTPGELKGRTERLHRFDDLAAVETTLEQLAQRRLALRLERRPGQKEDRWVQLMGGEGATETAGATPPAEPVRTIEPEPASAAPHERIDLLEERIRLLEGQVAALLDVRGANDTP